jgi:hypothetical protein
MIERAARDPSVDVDKLRQLMEMRQQVEKERAEREFDAAMADAQSKLRRIRADAANAQTKSKYASYAALDRTLRPIYTDAGFALSFNTEPAAENMVRVTCDLSHRNGHKRHYQIDMPADGKGAKGGDVMTKTHATGSAVTYGRRYLLQMIFNLAVGEDDDGNAANDTGELISAEQVKALTAAMEVKDCTEERLLKWASAALNREVAQIGDLPAYAFEKAMSKVRSL